MKNMSDLKLGSIIAAAENEEKSEVQMQVLKNNTEHILQWANIPARYKNAEPIAKTPNQEKLITAFKANYNGKPLCEARDMLLLGSVGTGKTHLSIAFMRKLAAVNIYCRYTTEHNLLSLYDQKKYNDFEAFKNVDVLVLDELGKRKLQDWQMIQIEELLSHRYNNALPTIYITNLEIEEFKAFVGDRVTDRLKENKVHPIVMDGESLRGKV